MKGERGKEKLTLKAGTVVHVGGIPVALSQETVVFTHPENIALVEAELVGREMAGGDSRQASDQRSDGVRS